MAWGRADLSLRSIKPSEKEKIGKFGAKLVNCNNSGIWTSFCVVIVSARLCEELFSLFFFVLFLAAGHKIYLRLNFQDSNSLSEFEI